MTTESALRSKVANWLVPYIGIKEGSTEHKAILALFNDSGLCSRYKMTTSDAWCATAVSAAFISCGLTSIFPCIECSCNNMITLAQAAGIWKEDDSYTPSVGDVIMYDWQDSGSGDNTGTPDHVGIVYSISGTSIKVIEGNKSDTVGYRSIAVNGKYIRGYIIPDYASVASGSDSNSSSTSLSAGAKVTLSGVNVYNTATTSTSAGTRTGDYYIWSEEQVSGRIRLTNKASNAGKAGQISFWVNVSDIGGSADSTEASVTYAVGDKVKVNGTIYGNGDGTGGSIKKSDATMYVVNVESSEKYTNYIGLAAKKGGTRQGWAKPGILTKM